MGVILDTSVLIEAERQGFQIGKFTDRKDRRT